MTEEFKVEYNASFSKLKYELYRKEYFWFGFCTKWVLLTSFESLERLETEMMEYKKYPKYYKV